MPNSIVGLGGNSFTGGPEYLKALYFTMFLKTKKVGEQHLSRKDDRSNIGIYAKPNKIQRRKLFFLTTNTMQFEFLSYKLPMIKEVRTPNCVKKCDVCCVSIPTGVRGKIGNVQLHKRPMEVAGISRILVGQSRK